MKIAMGQKTWNQGSKRLGRIPEIVRELLDFDMKSTKQLMSEVKLGG